jgi:phage shock protein PspC (stress-responsive transcriptional regulator)
MNNYRKPLYRIEFDRWIAGVCAGIAYSLRIPVMLIRIFYTFFIIIFIYENSWVKYISYAIILFYILAWNFSPTLYDEPKDYKYRTS